MGPGIRLITYIYLSAGVSKSVNEIQIGEYYVFSRVASLGGIGGAWQQIV